MHDESKYNTVEDYLASLPQNAPRHGMASMSFQKANERYTGKLQDARSILQTIFTHQLSEKIDLKKKTIAEIENEGIIFIDEIDKIVLSNVATVDQEKATNGRNPSSEGVQRDLLPLIEGTTISTKYGDINTTNILFICAGAFSSSKPSDMMPELLGRLPNRIALQPLTKSDFRKILTQVENNLLIQYQKLLETEGISLKFTDDAVDLICSSSFP